MTTTVPYALGSDTSEAAAHSMRPHVVSIEARVLCAIQTCGCYGSTADEIESQLESRHATISARVNALMRAGKIVDSGRRRKTRSGRLAVVWTAV